MKVSAIVLSMNSEASRNRPVFAEDSVIKSYVSEKLRGYYNIDFFDSMMVNLEVASDDPIAICEEIFDVTNNPSRNEDRAALGLNKVRSLSVGDVVMVEDRSYVCLPVGWSEI